MEPHDPVIVASAAGSFLDRAQHLRLSTLRTPDRSAPVVAHRFGRGLQPVVESSV